MQTVRIRKGGRPASSAGYIPYAATMVSPDCAVL